LQTALQGHADGQAALNDTKGALRAAQDRVTELTDQLANANAELADRADEITAGKRDLAVQQAELERLEQVVASQAAELGAAQQDTRTATENALAAERQRAAAEAEKAATLARCEKLETVTGDARADALAAEHKLKARIEEVKELAHQLGEASEELAERRKQALQLQANLDAAHATRQTLEQEVARLESALATARDEAAQAAAVPPPPPAPDLSGELASLKEEVREWEREVSSWKGKAEELEAELLVTSRAHRELETEAERLRNGTGAGGADEALLAELELMTRERNDMAAELAVLKAQAKGNEET
jgi:chromosome segregation ATPase